MAKSLLISGTISHHPMSALWFQKEKRDRRGQKILEEIQVLVKFPLFVDDMMEKS